MWMSLCSSIEDFRPVCKRAPGFSGKFSGNCEKPEKDLPRALTAGDKCDTITGKYDEDRRGPAMVRDMTSGSPMKLIVGFAVPIFLGNLFQQLYSVVDAMVLGRAVGADALAAVALARALGLYSPK